MKSLVNNLYEIASEMSQIERNVEHRNLQMAHSGDLFVFSCSVENYLKFHISIKF